jgi:hypothetical protein
MMFSEALPCMEYLLAIWAAPRKPLLVKLFLVRLPIRFRLECFVTESACKVLWR